MGGMFHTAHYSYWGNAMEFDTLWPGGPRFRQSGDGYPLSTDSVLLLSLIHI